MLLRPDKDAITTTPEEPTMPSAHAPQMISSSPVSKSESQQDVQGDSCSAADPYFDSSFFILTEHDQKQSLSFFCRDVLCGKLFCEGGNDNPNYGRMVSIGTCKAAFFSDTTSDQGQVETGTKCGDGKVAGFLNPLFLTTSTM